MTSEWDDLRHALEVRGILHRAQPVGYGGCGCENPRRHEDGCRWGLDSWRPAQDPLRTPGRPQPRNGCCQICGEPLDPEAVEQNDDRCSSCYRALFAENRRRILGRGGQP